MKNENDLLQKLIYSNGFTEETLFYRYTQPEFLIETNDNNLYISANNDPSEAVINIYDGDHNWLAVHAGEGLAFSLIKENEWADPHRIRVAVKLKNVIEQGGLVYPVDSTISYNVWYFTLPSGKVIVEKV